MSAGYRECFGTVDGSEHDDDGGDSEGPTGMRWPGFDTLFTVRGPHAAQDRRTSSPLWMAGRRASLFARRMSNRCQWRCRTCTKNNRMPQQQMRIVFADQ